MKPIYSMNQLSNVSVLIVIPGINLSAYVEDSLANYTIHGGTLVILSNGAMFGNQLLNRLGINASITGVIMDPVFNALNEYFPLAYTVNNTHLVLTLDNASALILSNDNAIILAETSAFSRLGNLTGPFIVAAEFAYGNGKLIVITTPSIFMNSLITMNNNEEFLEQLCGNSTVGILETSLSTNPLIILRTSLLNAWFIIKLFPINYVVSASPILILIAIILLIRVGNEH